MNIAYIALSAEAVICFVLAVLIYNGNIMPEEILYQNKYSGMAALLITMTALALISLYAIVYAKWHKKNCDKWAKRISAYPVIFFLLAFLNQTVFGMEFVLVQLGPSITELLIIMHAMDLWEATIVDSFDDKSD